MSDAKLIYTTERSRSGTELAKLLPAYYPNDLDSNNWSLLEPIGRQLDTIERDIRKTGEESHVQTANTVDGLLELAKVVDTPPIYNESQERYRTRVIAEHRLVTSEATAPDIIENVATILDTDVRELRYYETTENGTVVVEVAPEVIENLGVTTDGLIDIINRNVAVGFRIEVVITGEFEYQGVDEYEAGVTDSDAGYDGLDADGNPTGTGGTYSGILR